MKIMDRIFFAAVAAALAASLLVGCGASSAASSTASSAASSEAVSSVAASGEMTAVGVADIQLHDGDSYAFTYTK